MNIEHVKLFVRLASTHNISQAGQEMSLTPAVASSHIAKLEKALGTRLVHRTTRKVSLTQEGIAFLPHAEEVINAVEAAEASVGAGNKTPTGVLRVSAPASFGRMHLIPAMEAFMEAHPGLKVDYRFSDSIIDLVEGGFDIAIRNAELKDSSLVARKLAADTRIVCASPKYIAKHGVPSHPEEILEHNFINLTSFNSWTFETPKGQKTVKPKGDFRADNGEAVRDVCMHGLGIAVSSTWCCHELLESGALVPILTDFPIVSESAIWAVYPSSRMLAPKVRAFIDFFKDYFGDVPYWDQAINK
ncbi:LysR family transcriptional regulator [Vibrio superstes]|uniref:LysR family transcriptional regulator n=1 Tax=Vibrio superstes NBRC 103154 TaxID=1219062 RepID=A0A511QVY9_9VIBR|nr:LysR family transcriptional regulator [Vibrio superstes]GEM81530.1 LysR family transcriptional regulator [Vibrio superstes NBRC 103154]